MVQNVVSEFVQLERGEGVNERGITKNLNGTERNIMNCIFVCVCECV